MPELKKEQIDAIKHENGDLLVSASAGSGKTFVMISRLIRLITEKKATVREVLATTFTESAALDMKEKLRKAMIEEIEKTGDEYLIKQLSEIAYADISTIDSFCSRIVRKYFYVAGVSPDYAIADDTITSKLKKEALDTVMREYYANNDKEFLAVLKRHLQARSDDNFRKLIVNLYEYCIGDADPKKYFEQTLYNYTEEGFDKIDEEYKKVIDSYLLPLKESLLELNKQAFNLGYKIGAEFCLSVVDQIDVYLKNKSIYVFNTPYSVRLNFGKNLDEKGIALKEQAKELNDSVKLVRSKLLSHISTRETDLERSKAIYSHAKKIFEIVQAFSDKFDELKRDENVLDFADLEKFAVQILRDPLVNQEVKNKYKYIFVDEYQDVNGLQEELINLLSNNNVFMVGDAKQSIYGFRGCRPEFFLDKYQRLKKENKTVDLNYNFRSASEVIDMANKVFSYSMTEDFYGVSYKDSARLQAGGIYGKDENEHLGRAELHLLLREKENKGKEEPRIYNILDEYKKVRDCGEASPTAALVADLIFKECGKVYFDPKTQEERKITFSDICILSRNKNVDFVRDLIKGLVARNIPISSDAGDPILSRPEIVIMTSLLEILDCFYNDVPLATVMKSPIGNFSDEELLTIQRHYSDTFDGDKRSVFFHQAVCFVRDGDFEITPKVKEFCNYIDCLRELSDFMPAKDILDKVNEDKSLEEFLLALDGGKKKVSVLRFFISTSQSSGRNYTVKEFLTATKTIPKLFEYKGGAEDDLAVKLMTIHASKGLEFPVAIVCGLETNISGEDEKEEVFIDREIGCGFRYYNDDEKRYYTTPLRGYLKHRDKIETIKEELRLFYVALTRASYSLHLTFVGEKDTRTEVFNGANNFLEYVPNELGMSIHTLDEFELLNKGGEKRKVLIDEENHDLAEKMKKNFAFTYPYIEQTTLPIKTTVTAVNQSLEKEYKEVIRFDEQDGENKTSALAGTIAHKILEHYDFEKGLSLADAVEQMLETGVLSKEELSLIDLTKIQNALNGGAFDKIKGKTLYREKAFLVNVPANLLFDKGSDTEVLVQGKIDLLAVDKDSVQIIDYKYSSLSKDRLKEKYKKQLKLYAYAVEKVLKVKAKDVYLISLLTGETVPID